MSRDRDDRGDRYDRDDRDDRGAIAVVVAVLTTTLFGLLAIVVDLGLARDNERRAQTAADSAALAAATTLTMEVFGNGTSLNLAEHQAVGVAKTYAASNALISAGDWAGCRDGGHLADTPDADNTCISFDGTRARVVLPTKASLAVFGGVVGQGPVNVSAQATAQWAQSPLAACWLCVQSQHASTGLDVGDGTVRVDSGTIRVGTTTDATLSITGGSVSTDPASRIGYTGQAPDAATIARSSPLPEQVPKTAAAPGWPAFLTLPTRVASPGPCSMGIYSDITACTNFAPGLYVITAPNVFTGSASLSTDNNVFFYLTCDEGGWSRPCSHASDRTGGSLTWSRSADFHLRGWAPFGSGSWRFAIAVDPGNQAEQRMVDSGEHDTGRVYIDGMVFAPTSTMTVRAQGHDEHSSDPSALLDITGQITVDRLSLLGVGAALRQHGTPPATRPAIPVPVHLIQ